MFKKERCGETMQATANFEEMESMNMNMNMNYNYMNNMPMNNMAMGSCCPMDSCMPTMCPPVYECPQERVCHRTINYEVPHMIPCHTRMINHHVYHHSYTPCYSYSEEDEYSNVYGNRCC